VALSIEYGKKRHTIRWAIITIIILFLLVCGWFAYRWYEYGDLPPVAFPIAGADAGVDESVVTTLQIGQYNVQPRYPRTISIPTIGLTQARIFPVVLDSNSILTYPNNIHDVGWYEKSGLPGDGSVIILDGRSKGTIVPGPFAKLSLMKRGDKIVIERGDGQQLTYYVSDNEIVTTEGLYTANKIGLPVRSGEESLNIVADSGTWVPRLGMFDHRDFVRATLVSPLK